MLWQGKTADLHVPWIHPLLWATHHRTIHRLADHSEQADGRDVVSISRNLSFSGNPASCCRFVVEKNPEKGGKVQETRRTQTIESNEINVMEKALNQKVGGSIPPRVPGELQISPEFRGSRADVYHCSCAIPTPIAA